MTFLPCVQRQAPTGTILKPAEVSPLSVLWLSVALATCATASLLLKKGASAPSVQSWRVAATASVSTLPPLALLSMTPSPPLVAMESAWSRGFGEAGGQLLGDLWRELAWVGGLGFSLLAMGQVDPQVGFYY
jgi:hypothetical protein